MNGAERSLTLQCAAFDYTDMRRNRPETTCSRATIPCAEAVSDTTARGSSLAIAETLPRCLRLPTTYRPTPAETPGAAPGPASACTVERGRSAAVSTPPLALRGLPRRGQDLARARARYPARSRQHENPGLPDGRGDQSQAACRRPSCCPVGHLGTPRRRNGTLKSPSRPQQPNQPPNGRCRIVLHSPRSDGGFFNNPMIGKLLGHTQVQTTARYAHLARDSIQTAAARITGSIGGNLLAEPAERLDRPGN